jgi:hypothetical protein
MTDDEVSAIGSELSRALEERVGELDRTDLISAPVVTGLELFSDDERSCLCRNQNNKETKSKNAHAKYGQRFCLDFMGATIFK